MSSYLIATDFNSACILITRALLKIIPMITLMPKITEFIIH